MLYVRRVQTEREIVDLSVTALGSRSRSVDVEMIKLRG